MAYDILIKSGSVFDGGGGSPTIADIGISGGEIAAIGDLGNAGANLVINAYGKYITPGFIDVTNHSDTHLTLFAYPNLESLLMQGVTTIIGGNCGASLAPLASPGAINAIRKWVDPDQANLNWTTMGEFLKTLEQFRPGINFGTFIGYGTIRRGILGDEVRMFTPEEQERAKLLIRQGMEQGAFGLSFGLAYGHERISPTEEVIEFARVLAGTGGVVKFHLRSEGAQVLGSINEVIRVGREAQVPVHINHFKVIGKKSWLHLPQALDLVARAKASGLDISYDVSPYHTTGSALYLLIPEWARYGGFAELFKRIDDANERKKIIENLTSRTLHYDKILIIGAKVKNIVGKTIAEIAATGNTSNEEALLQIVRANEGRVSMLGRMVSKKNTRLEVQDKNSFISSDGPGLSQGAINSGNLAHPRSFGAFPHFWHTFVRDTNTILPEEAIYKITGAPAAKFNIKKRGVIAKGNFADIAIFDPRLFNDRATYQNPYRYPAGIEWVLLNGKVAVENGRFLATRAGGILTR